MCRGSWCLVPGPREGSSQPDCGLRPGVSPPSHILPQLPEGANRQLYSGCASVDEAKGFAHFTYISFRIKNRHGVNHQLQYYQSKVILQPQITH